MTQYYYKIIGENNYGNFPYKRGLNLLSDNKEEFNTEPICGPGGLYFCEIQYIFNYLYLGDTVCRVSIPKEAQVVAVERKFKADQIYIEEMMDLKDLATIKFLVENGADIHASKGNLLRSALDWMDVEIIRYLVEQGAEFRFWYSIALQMAATKGNLKVVQYLIEYHTADNSNYTSILGLAAGNGHSEIVQYLVGIGVDIHYHSEYALRWAANSGHSEVVQYLIEQGADPKALRRLAIKNRHLTVSRYLAKLGVSLKANPKVNPKVFKRSMCVCS